MVAWQEYQAGTDPTRADSQFKIIGVDPATGVSWLGGTNEANLPFQVWRCTNLRDADWILATNCPRSAGVNGTNTWLDPQLTSRLPALFYRVTTIIGL